MLGFNTPTETPVDPATDDLGLAEARVEVVRVDDLLPKLGAPRQAASPDYNAFTIAVNIADGPQQLLGFDLTRVKARVQASEPGVFIGKRENLAGAAQNAPAGFPVPKSGQLEIESVEAYYVNFVGDPATTATAAYVSVMVETSGQAF
ncbi:hypothetical protein SEA_BEE17_26 [Microbacterium phage Bee17]|nr:hypothetical protein SEA_BEE17_26 [Microbacterium phage Bee17]